MSSRILFAELNNSHSLNAGPGNSSIYNKFGTSPNKSHRQSAIRKEEHDEASDEFKAEMLRRHLVSREERNRSSHNSPSANLPANSASGDNAVSGDADEDSEEEFSAPLDVPGADITWVSLAVSRVI